METLTLAETEPNIVEYVRNSLPACDGRCRTVADLLIEHVKLGLCHSGEIVEYDQDITEHLSSQHKPPVRVKLPNIC
jgi:hypothetical protein